MSGCQVVHVNHGFSSTQSRRERRDEEFDPAHAPTKKFVATPGHVGRDATGHQRVLQDEQDTRDEVLCASDFIGMSFPQSHLDYLFGILKRHQVIRQTKLMLVNISTKPPHVAARDMLNVYSLAVSEAQQSHPDKVTKVGELQDVWLDQVSEMRRIFHANQAGNNTVPAAGTSGSMDIN